MKSEQAVLPKPCLEEEEEEEEDNLWYNQGLLYGLYSFSLVYFFKWDIIMNKKSE
jgi:hypothetical protein